MLRLFNERRRFLFFPVRWANSVTGWLLGLHSKSGTVRVSPAVGDRGPAVDVDIHETVQKAMPELDTRYMRSNDPSAVDGNSIVLSGGRLAVNPDFVIKIVRETMGV